MSKYFTFDSISTPITATKGVPVDYDFVVRNMTPEGTQDCIVFLFNDPSSPSAVSVLDLTDIYPGSSFDITGTQHIPHGGTYHGSGKLKYLETGTYILQFRACYPNYYTGDIVVDEVKDFTVTVLPESPPSTFVLNMVSSDGGSTNPSAGNHSIPAGASVSVEAFPYSDYEFNHWEFISYVPPWSGTDTRNPCLLFGGSLDRDITVTPVFVSVPPDPTKKSLLIQTIGQGSTNPASGTTYQYNVGELVTITATANSGWEFSKWTKDGIDAGSSQSITVVMDVNHTLYATFTQIEPEPPNTQWIVPALFIGLFVGIGAFAFWRYRK